MSVLRSIHDVFTLVEMDLLIETTRVITPERRSRAGRTVFALVELKKDSVRHFLRFANPDVVQKGNRLW